MSDGWVVGGTIASWLALIGIAIALYQISAQRRRVAVELLIHSWAKAIGPQGEIYHVIDIVNAGGNLAILKSLSVVAGEIVPNPQFPVEYSLDAGGHTRIWIQTPDPAEVWFRFEWVGPHDRRFEYASWRPMINGDVTELGKAWAQSSLRSKATPRSRWIRDRWPRAVGPDGIAGERMRVSWNPTTYSARRARMLPDLGSEPQWKFALMDPR